MPPPIEIVFFSRSLVKKYVIIITKILKLRSIGQKLAKLLGKFKFLFKKVWTLS